MSASNTKTPINLSLLDRTTLLIQSSDLAMFFFIFCYHGLFSVHSNTKNTFTVEICKRVRYTLHYHELKLLYSVRWDVR